MFTLPTDGAAGGTPSGTEKYYSFDYGRIHFICLDSMTSSRAPGSPMLTWLQADLANTTQDWIVAFWHHPAYTKGSHNSDTETQLAEMRTNVLPVLEAAGVDLVLAGHSHNYERSYFIDGHYGVSSTFNASMLENGGDGRENGNGAYTKLPELAANDGAVYVTAGNGGHVTSWVGGSTAEFNPSPHPAMYYSALHVGSMAIDVDGNRLDAKMIRPNGSVDDYFTIVKSAPTPPPAAPGGLSASAGNAQVVLGWSASSGATSYALKRATVSGGPYTTIASGIATTGYTDNSVSNGVTYHYVVNASNAGGTSPDSSQVSATPLPPAPPAPTGVAATAGNAQVGLSWNTSAGATSYTVKRATVSGGPYGTVQSGLAGTSYTDTSVANGTTYFYVVTATNSNGESGNSNQASATPVAPPAVPATPSNLAANAVSRTQVNLGWSDNANNETGYSIERSTKPNTGFAVVASVGANVASYADASVAANKQYYYRVRAVNGAGNSGYSNVASAKTPK
jgi:fibronectin type 3 domain-containing protein